MNKNYLFLFLLISFPLLVVAQGGISNDPVFFDLKADFNLIKKTDAHLDSETELNIQYNRPYWAQLSNDLTFTSPREYFSPFIGLITLYTYQEELVNYVEVRPYIGMKFQHSYNNLKIYNKIKGEIRNFFYRDNARNQVNGRLRDEVGAEYFFITKTESGRRWSLEGSYQWFFLKAPSFDESYSNSRQLSLRLNHYLKNGNRVSLHFVRNQFLPGRGQVNEGGHSFTIEYRF